MPRFAFPDLIRAFRDGERFGNATMRVVEVDCLELPTGRIVACDPGYLQDQTAYTRAIAPGRYPVMLALLASDGFAASNPNRESVACAAVRFREAAVERWEMALRPGWDPSTLKPGFHFGTASMAGPAASWTSAPSSGFARLPQGVRAGARQPLCDRMALQIDERDRPPV
jgi:hypothetical protein